MIGRSPIMNKLIKDWANQGDDFICYSNAMPSGKVVEAWVKAHPQKPFVVSSIILPEGKRYISILCTNCGDIHNHTVPIGLLSTGDKRIAAHCEEKYRIEDTYEYVDWGIGTKFTEKRVKVTE